MLRMSKQTRLKPEQILKQAANYFGNCKLSSVFCDYREKPIGDENDL